MKGYGESTLETLLTCVYMKESTNHPLHYFMIIMWIEDHLPDDLKSPPNVDFQNREKRPCFFFDDRGAG